MNLRFRPFAVIGFTSLSVLLSCVYFSESISVISIAAGLLLFVITVAFKCIRDKIFPFYIASAMMFSGLMFTAVNDYEVKYAQSFADSTVEISGVITDAPFYSNSRYYYILDLDRIDGEKVNAKIRVSLANEINAEPYDRITLPVRVYNIASENREIQLYYQSKGIFLGGYAFNKDDTDIKIARRDSVSVPYALFCVKEEINRRIFEKLPNENGATIIAMLLGDKNDLPDELNDKFREVGIAPIFAVSGLHLSVWIMGLYSLLSQLGVKKRLNSLIGILFTLIFMLLTGLTPSVCRAGVMMLLLLVGNLFYRKTDSLNSLGFAAFVLCAINPLIVADVGFLLSFSATLGIVTLMPLINKYLLSRFKGNLVLTSLKNLINIISVSITASVGVLPVTVFFIGYLSLFTIISNLLVTYVATVCMIFGGLTAITYGLPFISDFTALTAGLCSKYVLWIVNIIYNLSVTTISTDNFFWKVGVILSLGVLLFSLVCFKKKSLFKSIAVGMSFVVVLCSVSSYLFYDDLTQIRILDVGNGVSAVIFRNGQKIVLTGEADGYYKADEIVDNLNSISRTKSDLLLLGDSDGAEDVSNLRLVKEYNFDKIVCPSIGQSFKSITEESIVVSSDTKINLWDDSSIEFFCCDDYSLAYCTFNEVSCLFLFDSKKYVKINPDFLDADYLICSGYIPNCISPEKYKRVILCGQEMIEGPISEYVYSRGGNPLKAYKYESVRINIRNGNEKIYVMEG